jgi:hypothetical protein
MKFDDLYFGKGKNEFLGGNSLVFGERIFFQTPSNAITSSPGERRNSSKSPSYTHPPGFSLGYSSCPFKGLRRRGNHENIHQTNSQTLETGIKTSTVLHIQGANGISQGSKSQGPASALCCVCRVCHAHGW